MTSLDAKFVENARKSPIEFEHGINVVHFAASDAVASEGDPLQAAVLEVQLDGGVVGYILPDTDETYSAIPAAEFGAGTAVPFRTLEGALEHMLPGVADGLAEKPKL